VPDAVGIGELSNDLTSGIDIRRARNKRIRWVSCGQYAVLVEEKGVRIPVNGIASDNSTGRIDPIRGR